jgi:glyceraldehyde 3-phosphate dehydrogenase
MTTPSLRIGINGFGRIGRAVARVLLEQGRHQIVHINDINPDPANLAYLLKYDTIYGRMENNITGDGNKIAVDGNFATVSHERHIQSVNWKNLGVDVVIESTGVKENELAAQELGKAGINVLITNAAHSADFTLVFGISDDKFDAKKHRVVSTSICDTNACAPLLHVLEQKFGIDHGFITTLHPWLSYQNLMDGPSRSQAYPGSTYGHYALGRSSIGTLIPKPTTVVTACERILPEMKGRFQCMSYRVPTSIVSCGDLVITTKRSVDEKSIIAAVAEAAATMKNKHVFRITDEPLISSDYLKDPHSCIFDTRWLMVNAGHHVKMVLWYDNEWGYSSRVVDGIHLIAQQTK